MLRGEIVLLLAAVRSVAVSAVTDEKPRTDKLVSGNVCETAAVSVRGVAGDVGIGADDVDVNSDKEVGGASFVYIFVDVYVYSIRFKFTIYTQIKFDDHFHCESFSSLCDHRMGINFRET